MEIGKRQDMTPAFLSDPGICKGDTEPRRSPENRLKTDYQATKGFDGRKFFILSIE
jgi:hypothetical protein